jgi:transposase
MKSLAQRVVTGPADQIGPLQIQLTRPEKALLAWHQDSDLSQRQATIPGVGLVSATAGRLGERA